MEKFTIQKNIPVIGLAIKNMPADIGPSFEKLRSLLPAGDERAFYGIINCKAIDAPYVAAAEVKSDDEVKEFDGCIKLEIEAGNYISEKLDNWPDKTHMIKYVFDNLSKEASAADLSKPMIEYYKNMQEMYCLVRLDIRMELAGELKKVKDEVLKIIQPLTGEEFNKEPSEQAWSVAEVVEHLAMAARMRKVLYGPSIKNNDPGKHIEVIRNSFLNFEIKMKSPDFIVPERKDYDKAELTAGFEKMYDGVLEALQELDLDETCTGFAFPNLGSLTRLEIGWFIVYHTQRHIHQLKNILEKARK